MAQRSRKRAQAIVLAGFAAAVLQTKVSSALNAAQRNRPEYHNINVISVAGNLRIRQIHQSFVRNAAIHSMMVIFKEEIKYGII